MENKLKKLLLVEDDELLALTESQWLKKAGYKVVHVSTGEKAVALVNSKPDDIDLILMDINLGNGIDGTQAAEEILRNNDIPLLFLSAHTEKEIVKKTESITSYGYVVKDSKDVVLLASIKMAFKLHDANKSIIDKENELIISERRLQKAEFVSRSGNWEIRLNDKTVFASEGAAKIYGIKSGILSLEFIQKIPLPEYRSKLDDALKNLVQKNVPYDIEFKIKKFDTGEIIDIHSIAEYDSVENVLFGTIQDVSKQKEAEEILKKSEEKYRVLLDLAPDAFFQGNSRGYFITVNDKAVEMTGYSKDELLKMNIRELFSNEVQQAKPFRYDLLEKGLTIKSERTLTTKDGDTLFIEMNSKLMPDGTYQTFMRDITQRKRADEELANTKIILEQAFEQSPIPMILVSMPDAKIRIVNPACLEFLGIQDEPSVINTSLMDYKASFKDYDSNRNLGKLNELPLARSLRGQKTNSEERIIERKDGSVRWELVSGTPIYNNKGEIIAGYLIIADITERKQNEIALQKSEEKYRDLIEKIPDGIYKSSHAGKFLECNSALVKMLGYSSKEELYSIDIKTDLYFKPGDRESAALEEELEETAIFRLKKKDGSEIWVEDHGRHILDEDGNVLYHEGIMRDITERKSASERLLESEEKFRTIFENNSSAIAIIEADTTISMVNDAYCQMSGYSKEEVIGLSWTTQIPPEDLDRLLEYNRKRLLNPKDAPDKYEFYFYKKDGEKRYGLMSVSMMENSKKIITSFIDITERKESENQLKRAAEQLKEANAAKDKFFSIISHDLKNPFHSILSALKLILSEKENLSRHEIDHFLKGILNTSEKTYSLLENLLLWSRNQMGNLNFEPSRIQLKEVVLINLEFLKNNALQKNITIINEVDESVYVFADFNMLDTILRNLISNAIKFTDENGKIELKCDIQEDNIQVSILDNGLGIHKEDIDKLFRIGQSFSTLGTKNEVGTGLGLILCKEFVEKHKGRIWVNSEFGIGTEIFFTLPVIK